MSKIEKFLKDLGDPNSDEIFFSREAYEKERKAGEGAVIDAAMKKAKEKQEIAKLNVDRAIHTKVDQRDWYR